MRNQTSSPSIRRLEAVTDGQLQSLAGLLIDCVEGGASVSFMHPLPMARARAFWRGVADSAARGERALLVAEDGRASWVPCRWCWTSPTTSPIAPM